MAGGKNDVPTPDEFMLTCRYLVEIDGSEIETYFQEMDGLSATIEVLEYQEGGENTKTHKLLGQTKYGNIVLRRGVTKSLKVFDWIKKCIEGKAIERKTGAVILCNKKGDPVVRYTFDRAWPCRYEGPALTSLSSELAIETFEIAHEGLKVEKA